jgi:hypothetical protein
LTGEPRPAIVLSREDGGAVTAIAAQPLRTALGRTAAVLAVGSAAVHLLLVSSSSLGALVMAGMALACLPCAWHLWRDPTLGVWGMTAAIDAGMLALHAPMLTGGHHHGATASLMWLGIGLVAGQLLLAGTAALRR